ncbi:uncharacterized protein [Pleurodeles waltl]|uniref:uncharacterized protein n=1 Tax=Pleurodeles waltl TaxID=8319 RepID=UPI0037098640
MEEKATMADVIAQLAEGQRHLQLIWEQQMKEAKEEWEALQTALKSQVTIMANNQLVHETALGKLTDAIAHTKVHPTVPSSVLQRYQDSEDPDSFFTNFERVASTANWPEDKWGQYIAPLLTSHLQTTYQAINPSGNLPYKDIKKTILERVGLDTESYHTKFRQLKWQHQENPRTLYYRVQHSAGRWLQPTERTREEMFDIIVLEQYLDALPPTTRNWVRQHPGLTNETAVDLACAYHRGSDFRATVSRAPPPTIRPILPRLQQSRPAGAHGPERTPPGAPGPSGYTGSGPQCYNCSEWGHIARYCPNKKDVEEPMEIGLTKGRVFWTGGEKPKYTLPIFVNNIERWALIDSGCSPSVIRKDLVLPGQEEPGSQVLITCVHGDQRYYPLATVKVKWREQIENLQVGVLSTLDKDIILGTDYEDFPSLLEKAVQENLLRGWWAEAPSDITTEEPTREKNILSRRQKREQRRAYIQHYTSLGNPATRGKIYTITGDFQQNHNEDPTLKHAWQQAEAGAATGVGPRFLIRNNLLYRNPTPTRGNALQLVVPKSHCQQVLQLAHGDNGEGHLGREKTEEAILRRFYWPGVYDEIRKHCSECPKCQLYNPSPQKPAPLQPLPIIDIPFTRVGMDLIGPLIPSTRGRQYVLVLVDYATRYPEAIPLSGIHSKAISQAMIEFFSRVGFPKEILTDQGTPLMSRLMAEVCRLLGVKQIRTSVYHPQTDGLVERYNKTIKSLLRKSISEAGKDWEKKLPLVLYAIRTHVQASLGHSPFEMLFGRQPRTLLDMLAEQWEDTEEEVKDLLTYTWELRENLHTVWEEAHATLQEAQNKQKQSYDTRSAVRTLAIGDKALVLLPSSENKLLAKWQGPFEVIAQINPTTYKLAIPQGNGREQIYHINLLKKWLEPTGGNAIHFINAEVTEDIPYPMLPHQGLPCQAQPWINSTLEREYHKQLTRLVQHNQDVFSKYPGRTTLVQHPIRLKMNTVSRQRPYRIPEAKQKVIEEEVQAMLAAGIIEPSVSPWCSPVVLVPKPDGSTRFCVDYRAVNNLTYFDAYPMPRIDELIERLGQAKFLSTLDLTKGYWQIPLRKGDKEKTAFATPSGLYQFTVLPFGLHGAPATFQRLMDEILRPFKQYAAAYLDDIVIYSNTWEEHLTHLDTILQALRKAQLTANPEKCRLGLTSIKYLGYIVGNGLIRPQVEKIEAISRMSFPKRKKDIRAFLGLIGYYRRFIPHFSTVAETLTELLKNSYPNTVGPPSVSALQSFDKLKTALMSEPVLCCPDFCKPFVLMTDASDVGLGAVLTQPQDDDTLHPILFISRKLLPREVHYPTREGMFGD